MVKYLTIDLDEDIHEALSKLKDKKGLTWLGVLLDWKERMEASEEDIDKLVLNKITQQARWGGFYESIHADKPVVVVHPKYMVDILREGVSTIVVDLDNTPKKEAAE